MGMKLRDFGRVVFHLGSNGLTLLGAVITTSTGFTLVAFWLLELTTGRPLHPYAGIALVLILPGLFVLGLLLMPLGALLRRRRLRAMGQLPTVWPHVDLQAPTVRNAIVLVVGATVVNVLMLGTATYRGVEYMDSNQFCGLTCHKVMAPEYGAFLDSPHSRVGCVQCHIGPGAGWFVQSKLSGVRQVFAVALGTYSRPIPSPVHQLRPARETCEQCHWPQRFSGDKLLVRTKFGDDEKSSPSTTVLVLKIGGRGGSAAVGIHGRHLNPEERISYVATDGRRQVIPKVTYRDDDGTLVDYVSEDVKVSAADLAKGEVRKMDCIDCHNRPSHAFELPERAVDRAIEQGRVSRELPYIKKKAVELLRVEYPDRTTAERQIGDGLAAFYRASYPEVYRRHRALLEDTAREIEAIYLRNVYPDMKLGWGGHPNHIGHEDSLGCFRCHDESHKAASGKTITQDCNACHTILAQDETDPKILADLGLR
jgi:nitrate/TMAO reductase-like tetraheme cytochrome c subunit